MSVESFGYISALDITLPAATDGLSEADNHIRGIKSTLKTTFPNVTGAVTATHAQLNSFVPVGGIIDWYGASNAVPTGWGLCDGTIYARADGTGGTVASPDLRNRFMVGAGGTYAVGATGGSTAAPTITVSSDSAGTPTGSIAAAGAHDHGGVTGSHVLTQAELPSTQYSYNSATVSGSGVAVGLGSFFLNLVSSLTNAIGGGQGHTHSISGVGDHSHGLTLNSLGTHTHTATASAVLPPYYALCKIIKL